MGVIAAYFTTLIAEAIGLPPTAFEKYCGGEQSHKLKIVKYPDLAELGLDGEGQGNFYSCLILKRIFILFKEESPFTLA
ncbi:hypothetical protein M7I_1706 [Glarea lozoyensis 74030]|uniref:Uncharacterized protein n=1 Tax=Glarea lozoyensis (strain ATCC 74030 / MF5533) TaxID=1104152 RepID=H0EGT6_GLAL7|nr:hypothetical protein M7I_1706 [Glarea lozoyensis 74030]